MLLFDVRCFKKSVYLFRKLSLAPELIHLFLKILKSYAQVKKNLKNILDVVNDVCYKHAKFFILWDTQNLRKCRYEYSEQCTF
jgi:hypothetical protein